MTDVLIHSPFPRQSSQGNSVTADRLELIFQQAGLGVLMETERYEGLDARCMVALNARRSAGACADFKSQHPDRKLIVILTGTDINHPDARLQSSPTWQSMEKASKLVSLNDASKASVPEPFHGKCSVIYPSVTLPASLEHAPEKGDFSIVMAGNMRKEKNPELAADASVMLPAYMAIHVYGQFAGVGSARIIKHGMVPHADMLLAMSKAQILLNTSTEEGGANAICEAISMGLPVVASDIAGNRGMLGDGYAGLFPSEDLQSLVNMLKKCATDPTFYSKLKAQVTARAPLFAYSAEAKAWTDLVNAQLSS